MANFEKNKNISAQKDRHKIKENDIVWYFEHF